MKVLITTPFARLTVEMTPVQAATLLTEALVAAVPEPTMQSECRCTAAEPCREDIGADETAGCVAQDSRAEAPADELTAGENPAPAAVTAAPPHLKDGAAGSEDEDRAGFSPEEPTPEKGYRGFLHMKCGKCHGEKSFCTKRPLKEYRCGCGHTTLMKGLNQVVAKCDCGRTMNYSTNQDADAFELNCISCGKPVLVKWSFRRKRYERAN